MKLLLTADIHYSLPQYDWLARVAPGFDAVIVAGDHLDISSHVDGRAQIVVVLKYLERIARVTRLMVCSGNHDLDSRDEHGEKVAKWMSRFRDVDVPADGDAFSIGEMLFTICPWWDGPNAKQRIALQLARDAARAKKRWIWIYHAPPAGSCTSLEGDRSFGDAELARWMDQYRPDFLFCGHVHNAPFRQGGSWIDRVGPTWVFNAGRQIGPVPAHIVLSLDNKSALWFSLAGPEIAPLDGQPAYPIQKLTEPPLWLTAPGGVPGPTPA